MDVVIFVWQNLLWPLLLLVAIEGFSHPFWIFLLARLRVTDPMGYTLAAGTILIAAGKLWDVSPWWLAGIPVAFAFSVARAHKVVKRYRSDPKYILKRSFAFGKPPVRVKG